MARDRDLSRAESLGCALAGVAGAILTHLLGTASPLQAVLGGYLLFTALAIMLVDYRSFIIPDTLSLPAIPLGIVANAVATEPELWRSAVVDSLIGASVAAGFFYLIRTAYRRLRGFEGLGMGDVKLAAAAGAWVGLEALPLVLIVATMGALSAVLVNQAIAPKEPLTRTTAMPFGSFLAPALWLVWLYRTVIAPV
jgi:leader peptidase (prepilin peptidase)/N-methyltransferase